TRQLEITRGSRWYKRPLSYYSQTLLLLSLLTASVRMLRPARCGALQGVGQAEAKDILSTGGTDAPNIDGLRSFLAGSENRNRSAARATNVEWAGSTATDPFAGIPVDDVGQKWPAPARHHDALDLPRDALRHFQCRDPPSCGLRRGRRRVAREDPAGVGARAG